VQGVSLRQVVRLVDWWNIGRFSSVPRQSLLALCDTFLPDSEVKSSFISL
jgi:hypothetical protein